MSMIWAAASEIEPIAADTIAAIANIANYNVVSGCAQTYSAANMTKTVASGSVTHNGSAVTVAGNTVTLVSDPALPRFTTTAIHSSGTAVIISGDPAAEPAVPELGDNVMIGLDKIQAGQTIADNIVTKLDKRVMGVIPETVEGPLVPYGVDGSGVATVGMSVNTTARVGLLDVTHRITVASLAFEVTAVGTAGTLAFGLFSNDGQTRYINEVTANISGTGLVNTALSASVTLNPGLYYIMIVSQSTANITLREFGSTGGGAAPAGENEVSGSVTVTAGTIPTTFDPDADVTYAADGRFVIRLYS